MLKNNTLSCGKSLPPFGEGSLKPRTIHDDIEQGRVSLASLILARPTRGREFMPSDMIQHMSEGMSEGMIQLMSRTRVSFKTK